MPAYLFLLGGLWSAPPVLFSGGMLGVSADVWVWQRSERALVTLKGVPGSNAVCGGASYGPGSSIVLDDDLAQRLRQLHVRLLSATPSNSWDRLVVSVRLPLVPGCCRVTLWRRQPRHEQAC